MTKSINVTFAAALLAASVFGGSAALAGGGDGDYYPGVSRDQSQTQSQNVDRFTTQSIHNNSSVATTTRIKDQGPPTAITTAASTEPTADRPARR